MFFRRIYEKNSEIFPCGVLIFYVADEMFIVVPLF